MQDSTTPGQNGPEAPEPVGKKSHALWITLGVVFGLALLGGVGWYGYQLNATRSAASDQLREATGLIEDADVVVLEIDQVVRAEITAQVGEDAALALPKVDTAAADLDAAAVMLEAARPDLTDADVVRADALIASAVARLKMLEQATPILEANQAAGAAISPAEEGWILALDGEKFADEAVKEYNKLTKAAVSKSATLTVQAEAKFKEAKAKFDEANKAFEAAGLVVYVTYIDQKLAAIAISKQADAAFTAGNNAKANEYSNQYNAKDKQVIALAKTLPKSPSTLIATAYETQAGDPTKAYFQAREEATQADDELRALTE